MATRNKKEPMVLGQQSMKVVGPLSVVFGVVAIAGSAFGTPMVVHALSGNAEQSQNQSSSTPAPPCGALGCTDDTEKSPAASAQPSAPASGSAKSHDKDHGSDGRAPHREGRDSSTGSSSPATAAPWAPGHGPAAVMSHYGSVAGADTSVGEYERNIIWGDTLSGISSETGASVFQLVQRNQIADADLIYAGDTLVIPSK